MNKISQLLTLVLFTFLLFACSSSDSIIDLDPDLRPIDSNSSMYIDNVISYSPAPGQFMRESITSESAAQGIIGSNTGLLSLGSFGGQVTVQFDHTILNEEGADLLVFGNALTTNSEMGIVCVSLDANKNGIADDEWFELQGSLKDDSETISNYEVTYTNPQDQELESDWLDVSYTDNQGNSGVVRVNEFHNHSFWPEQFDSKSTLTFSGTRLPDNLNIENGQTELTAPEWGYADSYSSEYSENRANTFDFDNAVDVNGVSVQLKGADFIKVYSATLFDSETTGEASTEISGMADYHLYFQ